MLVLSLKTKNGSRWGLRIEDLGLLSMLSESDALLMVCLEQGGAVRPRSMLALEELQLSMISSYWVPRRRPGRSMKHRPEK